MQGPNLWPDLPEDDFRKPIEEYHAKLLQLDHIILKVLALGLPYSPNIFDNFVKDPAATVRLLHYPPQKSLDPRQLGGKRARSLLVPVIF
jgi:isopenicillin N synthase-like dioxygenase